MFQILLKKTHFVANLLTWWWCEQMTQTLFVDVVQLVLQLRIRMPLTVYIYGLCRKAPLDGKIYWDCHLVICI
jgi:hypothetical protein